MVRMMSGADELDALSHELAEFARTDAMAAEGQFSEIEHALAESLEAGEELFDSDGARSAGDL
jgi:hypothetical protein